MVQVVYKEEEAVPKFGANQTCADVADTAANLNGEPDENSAPEKAPAPPNAEPVQTEGEASEPIAALPFHPIAETFPLLEGTEFDALVADIKTELREPITTYEGKVLDGRNRLRACIQAGVTPRFEEYEGDDPVGFVTSKNLHRRHLTNGQRAMIGAELAGLRQGRPATKSGQLTGLRQQEAANLLKTSTRAIRRADDIRKHGVPELQDAVARGMIKVSAASVIATVKPERQRKILSLDRFGRMKAVKKIRIHAAAVKQRKANAAVANSSVPRAETPANLIAFRATEEMTQKLSEHVARIGHDVDPADLIVAPGSKSTNAR